MPGEQWERKSWDTQPAQVECGTHLRIDTPLGTAALPASWDSSEETVLNRLDAHRAHDDGHGIVRQIPPGSGAGTLTEGGKLLLQSVPVGT